MTYTAEQLELEEGREKREERASAESSLHSSLSARPPLDPEAKFLVWKQLEGARVIMARFYRITAGFYKRYLRRGIGVSQRLIEEQVRDSIRLGLLKGERWDGYALNSHFTRPLVKHMLAQHPEWGKLFELREREERRAGEEKAEG